MVTAGKPLYVGSFRHNLDAKNRLTIPARWRFAGDEKGEHYLALPHPDGYVMVLPPAEVEKLYAKVSEKLLSDRDALEWLSGGGIGHALSLLKPFAADLLDGYEVSKLVNNPQNDTPECIAPI
jgi:hypothetical protein